MTRGCWWSMFMWLIWVMSLHVYLKCTSHPGCSSVFLAFAWLEQWSSLNIQRGCCLIRWHHEAAAAARKVMLWLTKFKKPLKKFTVARSCTHESIWRWSVFFRTANSLFSISRTFVYYTQTEARDARGDFSICHITTRGNTSTTSPELLWESLHEHFTVWLE